MLEKGVRPDYCEDEFSARQGHGARHRRRHHRLESKLIFWCAAFVRSVPGISRSERWMIMFSQSCLPERFLEHSRIYHFENGGQPEVSVRQRRLDASQSP